MTANKERINIWFFPQEVEATKITDLSQISNIEKGRAHDNIAIGDWIVDYPNVETGEFVQVLIRDKYTKEPNCASCLTVVSGSPGVFTISPKDLQSLAKVDIPDKTAWTPGQYVVLGDGSHAHWDGTTWLAGAAGTVSPASLPDGLPAPASPLLDSTKPCSFDSSGWPTAPVGSVRWAVDPNVQTQQSGDILFYAYFPSGWQPIGDTPSGAVRTPNASTYHRVADGALNGVGITGLMADPFGPVSFSPVEPVLAAAGITTPTSGDTVILYDGTDFMFVSYDLEGDKAWLPIVSYTPNGIKWTNVQSTMYVEVDGGTPGRFHVLGAPCNPPPDLATMNGRTWFRGTLRSELDGDQPWPSGQYVVLGDGTEAYWGGVDSNHHDDLDAWKFLPGRAP